MNNSPINVAVIGTGKRSTGKEGWAIGHAHGLGWLNCGFDVRLHGVDLSPENLAAFGERFHLPASQLFTSTDAFYAAVKADFVSICTWPALHAPMVIDAANRGVRGVLCEKPLALDLGEMKQMRRVCADKGTRLAVAHQRRYELRYQSAHRLLREGAIGPAPWVVECRVGDDWDILSWTVHWFDMVNFLLGAAPKWVLAGGDVTGQRRYQHAVENASVIFADYAGDHQAIFVTGPSGYGITIRGSAGMMQVEPELKLWNESGFSKPVASAKEFHLSYAALMKELVQGAGNETPILCGIENCFAATEFAYAAHESMRTQRKVALPLTTQFAPLEVMTRGTKPRTLGHVVLVADVHHFEADTGQSGRDGLVEAVQALQPASFKLVKAEERELRPEDLVGADLLLIYHTQRQSTPAARQALEQWVGAGKPLVILHCGIGAYSDWQTFRDWSGLYWVWGDEKAPRHSGHPHEPSVIEITDPSFNVPWSEAWLPKDEVYIDLGQAKDVRMLATARRGAHVSPAAWQSTVHPNIAVWAPGHRADIWRIESMRQGLAATIVRAQSR